MTNVPIITTVETRQWWRPIMWDLGWRHVGGFSSRALRHADNPKPILCESSECLPRRGILHHNYTGAVTGQLLLRAGGHGLDFISGLPDWDVHPFVSLNILWDTLSGSICPLQIWKLNALNFFFPYYIPVIWCYNFSFGHLYSYWFKKSFW